MFLSIIVPGCFVPRQPVRLYQGDLLIIELGAKSQSCHCTYCSACDRSQSYHYWSLFRLYYNHISVSWDCGHCCYRRTYQGTEGKVTELLLFLQRYLSQSRQWNENNTEARCWSESSITVPSIAPFAEQWKCWSCPDTHHQTPVAWAIVLTLSTEVLSTEMRESSPCPSTVPIRIFLTKLSPLCHSPCLIYHSICYRNSVSNPSSITPFAITVLTMEFCF